MALLCYLLPQAAEGSAACPTNTTPKLLLPTATCETWPSLTCIVLLSLGNPLATPAHKQPAMDTAPQPHLQAVAPRISSILIGFESHMSKPNSVSKLPKLLVSYFLESSRVQAMGVLLQINHAQRVWNPLLDPECKNLHEQCL